MVDSSKMAEEYNARLDAERVKIQVLAEALKERDQRIIDLEARLNYMRQTECEG